VDKKSKAGSRHLPYLPK